MRKRGVELSMNIIIIAAIALIVLVVLVLLITNTTRNVQQGTGCSELQGAQCTPLTDDESCGDYYGDGGYTSVSRSCGAGETCCYKPFE